jgi:hypothetical protein
VASRSIGSVLWVHLESGQMSEQESKQRTPEEIAQLQRIIETQKLQLDLVKQYYRDLENMKDQKKSK